MENKNSKHILQLFLVLVVGIAMGFFVRFDTKTNPISMYNTSSDLTMFEMVYDTIVSDWVGSEEIDFEAVAIEGFLNNLGDPHTTYFTLEESQDFTSAVEGSFAGIGVTYSMTDEGGKIASVMQETPASEAGLQAEDIIIAVDDVPILDKTNDEVKELVTGQEGANVKITILRDGKEMDFNITRRKIDSSVTWEIREDEIGFLDINTFGNLTHQSIEKALLYFKANNIETIAIDLRDNTGGYLSSVENILSLFLEKGTLLFSIEGKEGPATEYYSNRENVYTFRHGYILTNGISASASEVMAAALSEQLDYTLVGKTTYGKGTAQTQVTLSDMTSVKYTYAKWLTPSGKWINEVGIEPDVVIEDLELNDFYVLDFEEYDSLQYDLVSMHVADLQLMLQTIGYDPQRTDGYFDKNTEEALKAFERDNDLTVDGMLTKDDYSYLEQALVSHFNNLENDAAYQYILEETR